MAFTAFGRYAPASVIVLLLGLLGVLAGCQSSAGERLPELPTHGDSAGEPAAAPLAQDWLAGLPPLPAGSGSPRQVNFANVQHCDGSAIYSSSAACFFAGESTVIPSAPGSLEYAMYAFNTAGYDPNKLEAGLAVSSNAQAWIGVSNYQQGAWQFFGPFSGLASVNLSGFNYLSPGGQFFALVVAHDGVTVSSDYLVVSYENGVAAQYSISGTVLDEHGAPIGGVRVTSDPEFVEALSDAQGQYYLALSSPGDYTLNPSSLDDYFLTPMSPFVTVDGHETGVDFTGSRVDVQGRITTTAGAALAGVLLVLNPGALQATSGADGRYEFRNVAAGLSTVEPQLAGYTFEPLGQNIDVGSADYTGCDFVASGGAPTYAIRGNIALADTTPVAGVTLILNPGYRIARTDASGNYAFFALGNGTYSLEPHLGFYGFAPLARTETVANASVLDADFTATAPPPTYALSGTVMDGVYALPLPNALVRISRKESSKLVLVATRLTGIDGRFSVDVPNGEYLIYPEKNYYQFQSPFWEINNAPYDYIVSGSFANGVSWNSFVQGFISNNCLQCHRPDSGTAATPYLRTYDEVKALGNTCNFDIQNDTMPPSGGNLELYQKYFQEWTDEGFPLN